MSKSLKAIQVICKIAKILSKIAFICCIIGAAGCLIGITTFGAIGNITVGELTLHGLIEESADMSVAACYDAMIAGLILCAAQIVITKFAEMYFSHELLDGTPFTEKGYKELFRLGVIMASVSLGASILASISHGVISALYENVGALEVFDTSSIAVGVLFMLISLILRCALEEMQKKSNSQVEGASSND